MYNVSLYEFRVTFLQIEQAIIAAVIWWWAARGLCSSCDVLVNPITNPLFFLFLPLLGRYEVTHCAHLTCQG